MDGPSTQRSDSHFTFTNQQDVQTQIGQQVNNTCVVMQTKRSCCADYREILWLGSERCHQFLAIP